MEQGQSWQLVHEIERLKDEVALLRLTEAERRAIEVACQDLRHADEVATLQSLLDRHSRSRP